MSVFDQMMSRYEIRTEDDRRNAIHEVMQEVALAGLYRSGFLEKPLFMEALVCGFFTPCQDFLRIWISHWWQEPIHLTWKNISLQ